MNMGAILGVIEGRRFRGRVVWRLRCTGELIYPTMHCPTTPDLWQVGVGFGDPRLALHQGRLITFLCAGVDAKGPKANRQSRLLTERLRWA